MTTGNISFMTIDMHLQSVFVNFGPDFDFHRPIFYLSLLMQLSIKQENLGGCFCTQLGSLPSASLEIIIAMISDSV